MKLDLAEVLALGESDDYAITAALSGHSVALALCVAAWLNTRYIWEGVGYVLTENETDQIDELIATLIQELTTAYVGNGGNGEAMSIAVIADQKTLGTEGGTFTLGAMRIRDLNTVLSDPGSIVSVADNKFTLQAGTYFLLGSVPAYRVTYHQGRFWNETDSEEIELGTSEMTAAAAAVTTRSWIGTVLVLDKETDIELQHESGASYANTGFGKAGSLNAEIYSFVIIIEVSE